MGIDVSVDTISNLEQRKHTRQEPQDPLNTGYLEKVVMLFMDILMIRNGK